MCEDFEVLQLFRVKSTVKYLQRHYFQDNISNKTYVRTCLQDKISNEICTKHFSRIAKLLEVAPDGEKDDWGEDVSTEQNLYQVR